LIRNGARVDAFHERGDTRGVAEPRAVIDVVRAEARADELLKEIRLFVRALGRAESREGALAVRVANVAQALRRQIERFVPRRFAEHIAPLLGIDDAILVLRMAGLPDQ